MAKETGLSIATISRVMNGATNVKAATREKVLSACVKLDYVPNPAARTLSTNRSKTVAVIIPTIEHSVFAKYITGIEQALNQRGYSLVLAISNADPEEECQAARKLLGMGAEAFVLTGAEHSQDLLDMFLRRGVPFVFTSIFDKNSNSPTIGYDNQMLATRAIEYLANKGHKKIAVVHGPLDESDRTRARCVGARKAGCSGLQLSFYEVSLNVEGGKIAVQKMLACSIQYSVILCFSDVLALGAYFALAESDIEIPNDISVMGFDNLDWSEHVVPSLTTIDLPAEKMGVEVINQLVDCLENDNSISAKELGAAIIERDSVRAIN